MCRAVTCRECGKTTWSGCGEHVEEALAGVPESQRCAGHETGGKSGGFRAKLFGR